MIIFLLELLCHLNKKITLKTVAEKIVYTCICFCVVLSFAQKSLKLSRGFTNLCNFVNKDYDYEYEYDLLCIKNTQNTKLHCVMSNLYEEYMIIFKFILFNIIYK